MIRRSKEISRDTGWPWWESGTLAEMAHLLIEMGRLDDAAARARKSLEIARDMNDRAGRVFGVGLFARLARERDEFDRVGRLWGAIEGQDAVAPLGGWRRHRDAYAARIFADPGEGFEAARRSGKELTLEDARGVRARRNHCPATRP